ncbi:6443_t:CDS:2, partial [Gigaspora rosea]
TSVDPQKTNTQRSSSRISRIINSLKWITFQGGYFGTPPPKYSTWKHDKTLGKLIPLV